MKMKTTILLLNAAASLSLLASASSCTKTRTDIGPETGTYIEFASALTKTPVNTPDDMSEFAVWAYYQAADGSAEIQMENIKVHRESDNSWSYAELQTWKEGDWHFEALYPLPSSLETSEITSEKDALEWNFTISKDGTLTGPTGLNINYYYGPTASHDLMTASHDRTYSETTPNSAPVQFTFSHLLSRVSIAVKAYGNDVFLHSLTFSGMSILGEFNTQTSGVGKWNLLTSIPELSNVQPGNFSANQDNIQNPLPSDGTPVTVLPDLLLIPQTPGGSANAENPVKIDIAYQTETGQEQRDEVYLPSTTTWESGKHYKYTLMVSGADVGLNVNIVKWDERNFSVEF